MENINFLKFIELCFKNPNYGLEIRYNIKKKNRKSVSYTITNPCITESLLIPIAGRKVLNISNLQISEVKMILCY
ncbi:MAG: hypothetical protein LJD31_05090 [Wolbachia endosymbiont of Menacanthus eurysternus]|nr:hypothetical protein [Wolbachia endosymbiont of Menacanthus eurysternus]